MDMTDYFKDGLEKRLKDSDTLLANTVREIRHVLEGNYREEIQQVKSYKMIEAIFEQVDQRLGSDLRIVISEIWLEQMETEHLEENITDITGWVDAVCEKIKQVK